MTNNFPDPKLLFNYFTQSNEDLISISSEALFSHIFDLTLLLFDQEIFSLSRFHDVPYVLRNLRNNI